MSSSRSSTDTIVGVMTDAMMMAKYAGISKNRAAPSKLILPTYKDGDVNTYKSEAIMISYDGSTIIGHRLQDDGSGNSFIYPCVWNGDNTVNTILPVSNNDNVVVTSLASCNASGSIIKGERNDNITGSAFQPYITTVGLYNDANELIAVGKMAQPVPKPANTEMTIIVKIDI